MAADESLGDRSVNRRRLLRRAGTVAAGVAGAGVVTAVAATPAQATDGAAIVQGQTNTAGSGNTTTIANNGANATLTLTNAGVDADGDAGAPLRLTPAAAGKFISDNAQGSIGMTAEGELQVASAPGYLDLIHTTSTANVTVPINPQRVFDTRFADQRSRIMNAGSCLDSTGRVIAGRTLLIDLADYVYFGENVFGNVTAVQPSYDGFVTIFPWFDGSTVPLPSNLNFAKALFALSNAFVSGIGINDASTDVLAIYVHASTHLILDVAAFSVSFRGQVNPNLFSGAGLKGVQSKAEMRSAAGKAGLKASWSR